MSRWWNSLGILMLSWNVAAQDLTLQNLNEDDFKKVAQDFSAVFNHTSVSGASSLGRLFGFELGLVGGLTNTKRMDEVADNGSGSNQDADQLPHAELLGALTVPLGITAEVGLIPKVGDEKFKFNTFTAAVKWTPTDILLDWPLSVAVKAHITKTAAEFKQDIQTVPTQFEYDNTITAFTLLASKNFVLVEPYVGVSWLSAKGEMSVSGSPNVFDPSFTTGMSASTSATSTGFMLGTEVKLLIFKLGVEYANLFGTSRYTGKLAFYF